ncbi:hypothetical protein [Flaviflagellibacter deserti]|uniref:Uncharacterized protein n=1 Tax=Flaviflagellibacter deserti TaxID=2267266 RepID=A0ABV9YVC6_9HYPH
MDGFYSAFFTGLAGNSVGMFVFKSGVILGTDIGGMHYDGSYQVDEAAGNITGRIVYVIPAGTSLITGVSNTNQPLRVEFPLELPLHFADGRVVTIQTPSGTINARFQKLRDWI